MGVALVHQYWVLQFCRQCQLGLKSLALLPARRKVPVVVQAAFPYGDDSRLPGQLPQFGGALRLPLAGMMGVDTSCGVDFFGVLSANLDAISAFTQMAANKDKRRDTLVRRFIDNSIEILFQVAANQIDSDIQVLIHCRRLTLIVLLRPSVPNRNEPKAAFSI